MGRIVFLKKCSNSTGLVWRNWIDVTKATARGVVGSSKVLKYSTFRGMDGMPWKNFGSSNSRYIRTAKIRLAWYSQSSSKSQDPDIERSTRLRYRSGENLLDGPRWIENVIIGTNTTGWTINPTILVWIVWKSVSIKESIV
jgi:hypothetical protein